MSSRGNNSITVVKRIPPLSEEPKGYIHILTSGETRNPIGSKASLHTMIGDAEGAYMISLSFDGNPFNPEVLDEKEDPRLSHLEDHIRQQAMEGAWKLRVVAPLWDATWERNAEGDWLCTDAGEGYA